MTTVNGTLALAQRSAAWNQAQKGWMIGPPIRMTHAEFTAELALERAAIIAGDGSEIWPDGQKFEFTDEAFTRVWTKSTALGSPTLNANASHARKVVVNNTLTLTLAADSSVCTSVTSLPTSGGADGDVAVNLLSDLTYKRAAGVWGFNTLLPRNETLGSKLRRLAQRAALSNSVINKPLLAPPAWATGVAKLAGNVVSNAGNWYVALSSGTTGSTAPTTTTDGDSHTDGGVPWVWLGPAQIAADDPEAPVVTFNTTSTSATYPNVYNPLTTPSAYLVEGGYAVPYRTNFWEIKAFNTATSTPVCRGATVTAMVEAAAFCIFIPANAGPIFVKVDGRYVSPSAFNPGGADSQLTLDFSAVGSRARRVTVETNKSVSYFGAIRVKAIDSIWAPTIVDPIKVAWISDSLMAGSAFGPFAAGGTAAQRAGQMLGWSDNRVVATGSTGYVATNGGASYTYGQRIPEMLIWQPDVWMFMGSSNDITNTGVQAAQQAAFQQIRAGGSRAPIGVLGVWPIDDAGVAGQETFLQAAIAAAADPLGQTYWMPVYGAQPLPWVTHSNNNSALTTSVNKPLYIPGTTDVIHPSDPGTLMESRRIDGAVRSVMLPAIP